MAAIACVAVLSIVSILSYNVIAEWQIYGRDLNGVLDYLANNIMLPLGGLLIAVFVGWFVSRESAANELALSSSAVFGVWHTAIRYLVPPALAAILVFGITG